MGLSKPLQFADTTIEQTAGSIQTAQGGHIHFSSTQSGSILLTQDNRFDGSVSIVSQSDQAAYQYQPQTGQSLIAFSNPSMLRLDKQGIEADMVALSAGGIQTLNQSKITARLPYDDLVLGQSSSIPGLLLSVDDSQASTMAPLSRYDGVRISVGEAQEAGFVTVVPKSRTSVQPGLIVFMEGPELGEDYLFFYDGAGDPVKVPVSYNGVIPSGTSQAGAISSLFSGVEEARLEEMESSTQSENIRERLRNGVISEAGPGRPATEGEGSIQLPKSEESTLDDLSYAVNPYE